MRRKSRPQLSKISKFLCDRISWAAEVLVVGQNTLGGRSIKFWAHADLSGKSYLKITENKKDAQSDA